MREEKLKKGQQAIYVGGLDNLLGKSCKIADVLDTSGNTGYEVRFQENNEFIVCKGSEVLNLDKMGKYPLTIAIDFDDTIAFNNWPEIGDLREGAKQAINQLHDDGHYIIINTCRHGDSQHEAEVYLYQHGIRYHAINRHNPTSMLLFKNDTRKVWADIYIDDKNLESVLYGLPEWSEIYRLINIRSMRLWLEEEYTEKRIPENKKKEMWISWSEPVSESSVPDSRA